MSSTPAAPVSGAAEAGDRAAERPAPRRVSLPSIGADSDLVSLGLQADGTLEVPSDFALAGWYRGGGRPGGGPGPVVIAGHVDSRDGPAVFFDLRRVAIGDLVEVTVADGDVTSYRVHRVERFAKNAFPSADVFGATLGDELRVITCGGTFDRSARSYRDNTVVFATAV